MSTQKKTSTLVQKAEQIRLVLEQHFPDPAIPLDHRNPFTFLVAVMMSASANDKKVNQVTPTLFDLADTPEKMRQLSPQQIESIIHDVGLATSKANNIHKTAEILYSQHNSILPNTFAALEALPGVGHKTASVIMSQVHNIPAFAVDTHIHRLAYRWGLSNGKSVQQTETDLKAVFSAEHWNKLHLQIIYFGRAFCPALRHDSTACPICSWAGVPSRLEEEKTRTAPWQNK